MQLWPRGDSPPSPSRNSSECRLTVPTAGLGTRRVGLGPEREHLGPLPFGCPRVEAARPAPPRSPQWVRPRFWEPRGEAQPLLPPSLAPTAQPKPRGPMPPAPRARAGWFPAPRSGVRVAARPCSLPAGAAGAGRALTSRPAARSAHSGRPTSVGPRGGGVWPWLGQRGAAGATDSSPRWLRARKARRRASGLSPGPSSVQSRRKNVAQPPW